jgi:hypothetical protein
MTMLSVTYDNVVGEFVVLSDEVNRHSRCAYKGDNSTMYCVSLSGATKIRPVYKLAITGCMFELEKVSDLVDRGLLYQAACRLGCLRENLISM